jgi:hypothetical protein
MDIIIRAKLVVEIVTCTFYENNGHIHLKDSIINTMHIPIQSQTKTINSILTSGRTSKKLDLCTIDFNNTKLFR